MINLLTPIQALWPRENEAFKCLGVQTEEAVRTVRATAYLLPPEISNNLVLAIQCINFDAFGTYSRGFGGVESDFRSLRG